MSIEFHVPPIEVLRLILGSVTELTKMRQDECKHLCIENFAPELSALERPDWRDVDVRLILSDDEFRAVFPTAHIHTGSWEFDSRWLLLNVAISGWLSAQTGLPIDFQIQPQTHANERHKGPRNAVGLKMAPRDGSTSSGGKEHG